ncbi:Calcium-activated potassium channel subunit alpha-1 [Chara braunii]|uniref:Calcium-activated potassium channel subunit alpha-1 n=1 Tax=Chara braunii TaxID=69332 RepID=A0A388JYD8_CHABU|nr:Calcium-activated potassium channel subunit alpha-1 [Chara braunii]|eukprot:GBG62829.1 Calcium-activated potassium channel subunit alpha-1 [Chara braunii]
MERCRNIHRKSDKSDKISAKSIKRYSTIQKLSLPVIRQLYQLMTKGKHALNFMFFEMDKRGQKKYVDAPEETLSTYHESFLYGRVPLTIKVRAALRAGKIGYTLALVEFVLALLSVILYIRSTYTSWNPLPVRVLEIFASMYFVVDYLLKVYSAPFRVLYIFSRTGLVDLLSALPVIYVFQNSARDTASAIQLLRFLRILRLFHLIRRLGVIGSTVMQQIFVLVMYTLGIVFVMSGFFQYAEWSSNHCHVSDSEATENCIDFYGAFYFMIVTILTVGNGPSAPTSEMGRFVVLITIFLALTILPVQITKISDLTSRRPYGGTYSARGVLGARFDYAVEDAGQMAGALSVHQYCGPNVRIITELLNPENLQSDIWEGLPGNIETICPQQLRFQLLARSCYVKGLSTLVSNLFVSAVTFHPPEEDTWEEEYCYGLEHEVYPVLLPEVFHNRSFKEVAEFVYVEFSVLLIGLDITASLKSPEVSQMDGYVLMFPKDHRIGENDVGIIIAESLAAVQAVSAFGATQRTLASFLSSGISTSVDTKQLWEETQAKWEELDDYGDTELSEIRSALSAISSKQRGRVIQIDQTGADQVSQEISERILAWPPKILPGKPRLPVIATHENAICANLRERTVSSVKFQNHILVCCECQWPRNLYYFVDHLRLPGFPTPPIVILSPHEPKPEQWGCLGIFQDVFYIKGTATSKLDLFRAGLPSVKHVVVLTEDLSEARGFSSEDDDTNASNNMYANDLTNTIVVTVVEGIHRKLSKERLKRGGLRRDDVKQEGCVTAELRYNPTFRYVKPLTQIDPLTEKKMSNKKTRDGLYMFLPCYAEGKAFAPDMLDYVLSSSFTNKNTVSLVEGFIIGKPAGDRSQVVLDMIDTPSDCDGLTYLEVFRKLLAERDMLALGLYRATSRSSTTPYVFTNPWHDVIINEDDRIYVFWTKTANNKSYRA